MRGCNRLGRNVDASACSGNAIRSVCEALVEHTLWWLRLCCANSSLEHLNCLSTGRDCRCRRRCLCYHLCFRLDHCGRWDRSRVDGSCSLDVASRRRRGMCLPYSLCPVVQPSLVLVCDKSIRSGADLHRGLRYRDCLGAWREGRAVYRCRMRIFVVGKALV